MVRDHDEIKPRAGDFIFSTFTDILLFSKIMQTANKPTLDCYAVDKSVVKDNYPEEFMQQFVNRLYYSGLLIP